MSKAKTAAEFVKCYAEAKFGKYAIQMSKYVVDYLTFADIKDSGSHKYIPADDLSAKLGQPADAGVYGYVMFQDGSYILLTCHAGIAWWDGGDAEPELVWRAA